MIKSICILLLFTLLAGCQPKPAQSSAFDDQADIYAAVIQRLYGVENQVIPNSFPVLYIAQALDDRGHVLNSNMQRAIQSRLTVLPAKVIWVPTSRDVPWEANGTQVKGGGAGINLGLKQPQKDGMVQVAAGIVYANLGAHGGQYVLAKQHGIWTVTGTAGPKWIS